MVVSMRFGYLSYAPSFRVPVGAVVKSAKPDLWPLPGVGSGVASGFQPDATPSLFTTYQNILSTIPYHASGAQCVSGRSKDHS